MIKKIILFVAIMAAIIFTFSLFVENDHGHSHINGDHSYEDSTVEKEGSMEKPDDVGIDLENLPEPLPVDPNGDPRAELFNNFDITGGDSSLILNSDIIELESVDPRGGVAQALRKTENDVFKHRVEINAGDPQEGFFYEGWLVKKPSLPIKFYSTGALEKNEHGHYVLYYEAPYDERAEYNEVVITEETLADGLDGKPEEHIFDGRFN